MWINLVNSFSKEHPLFILIVSPPMAIRSAIIINDGYYVAYKPIPFSCILFMFIEMKFIHCHSCFMFAMKSMSKCND